MNENDIQNTQAEENDTLMIAEATDPCINHAIEILHNMKSSGGVHIQNSDVKKEEKQDVFEETTKKDDGLKVQKEQEKQETVEESSSKNESYKDFESMYKELQKEIESKSKRAEDNQRHARQMARNISSIKRHIMELQESMDLDPGVAESLLEVANKNVDTDKILTPAQTSKENRPEHISGMEELTGKVKEILHQYLEISPNAENEWAFAEGYDTRLNLMSEEERKMLYESLKGHKDNPKALLKAMLDMGKDFLESSIGTGLKEHGSLVGIIDAQASMIDDLNKKIEKLYRAQKKEQEKENDFKESKTLVSKNSFTNFLDSLEFQGHQFGYDDQTLKAMGGKY